MTQTTQAERIMALEVKVDSLEQAVRETNTKLGELISLKNKGMGAFWLASLVVGFIAWATASSVWQWFKGH